MAPEQLEGQDADARTDIFAFGAVLYEMVTGKKAFEGKSQAALIGAIMHSEPPPLTRHEPLAPPMLDRVVRKCLAKDPESRWQTARDLVTQLTWIAEGGAQPAASGSGPAQGRTPCADPARVGRRRDRVARHRERDAGVPVSAAVSASGGNALSRVRPADAVVASTEHLA